MSEHLFPNGFSQRKKTPDDSVDGFGKGTQKLVERYKKWGINHVELKQYPKARHEVLHDHLKNRVQEDIIGFLEAQL